MLINIYNSKGDYSNKSNLKLKKFKISSYYSQHYSNSAVTIQIVALFKISVSIQIRNMNSA